MCKIIRVVFPIERKQNEYLRWTNKHPKCTFSKRLSLFIFCYRIKSKLITLKSHVSWSLTSIYLNYFKLILFIFCFGDNSPFVIGFNVVISNWKIYVLNIQEILSQRGSWERQIFWKLYQSRCEYIANLVIKCLHATHNLRTSVK